MLEMAGTVLGMYALYFNGSDGSRVFITAVDDRHAALSMAKHLSRQDPRDIVVIENRPIGDTELQAVFRRGAQQGDDHDAHGAIIPGR